jgi:Ca-activated chloride channel homolog
MRGQEGSVIVVHLRFAFGLLFLSLLPLACGDAESTGRGGEGGVDADGSSESKPDGPAPATPEKPRATGGSASGGGANGPAVVERSLAVAPNGQANYGDGVISYRSDPEAKTGVDGLPSGFGGASSLASVGRRQFPTLPTMIRSEPTFVEENPFIAPADDTTSTFSIDSNTASYVLSRQSVAIRELPDPETVLVEGFLNYFDFNFEQPAEEDPLSVYTELAPCPWNPARQLLMVGLEGQEVSLEEVPPAHITFLVDVSGSMRGETKLDLVKLGLKSVTLQLRPDDTLSIVTYSDEATIVLENEPGDHKVDIVDEINALQADGSTNGAAGLQMAYELAETHFRPGGTNRILLATDGDFNVGLSTSGELQDFVEEKRQLGVFMSVLGYGMSSSGSKIAEAIAHAGDGVYFHIDSAAETRRALTYALSGVLMTVAADVKWRVSFNPEFIKGYRLLGYEGLLLSEEEFFSEWTNAGELGAGLTTTALFELIPADSEEALPPAAEGTIPDASGMGGGGGFGGAGGLPGSTESPDGLIDVTVHYRRSDEWKQRQLIRHLEPEDAQELPSVKFMFAAGMAEFAMRLRGSQYMPAYDPNLLVDQLELALPLDEDGAVAQAVFFLQDVLDIVGD